MKKDNFKNENDEDPMEYSEYEEIEAQQNELKKKLDSELCMARLCPFCHRTISIVAKGEHGYTKEICPHCHRDVVSGPLKFRKASSNSFFNYGY